MNGTWSEVRARMQSGPEHRSANGRRHRGTRSLVAATCWLAALACGADDRPSMTGPPPGLESAKRLSESIAESCNSKDFVRFMGHFSPRHAGRIRQRMEDVFTQFDMQMEIEDVILLSEQKDRLVFALRYTWHERSSPRRTVASRVTAVRNGGEWKVDSEDIRRVQVDESSGCDSSEARDVVINGRTVGGCANGQCGR